MGHWFRVPFTPSYFTILFSYGYSPSYLRVIVPIDGGTRALYQCHHSTHPAYVYNITFTYSWLDRDRYRFVGWFVTLPGCVYAFIRSALLPRFAFRRLFNFGGGTPFTYPPAIALPTTTGLFSTVYHRSIFTWVLPQRRVLLVQCLPTT